MLELHVWGDTSVSLISPESVAAAHFLSLRLEPSAYRVIASSNTNLSPTGRLPVLRDGTVVIDGYSDIVRFVNEQRGELMGVVAQGALAYLSAKLALISAYTLYLDADNYTAYTRPLFQRFLPFPMMYNQPLRFHAEAEAAAIDASLVTPKAGLLDQLGLGGEKPQGEEVALSELHAQHLLRRNKEKNTLAASGQTMRCVRFFQRYMDEVVPILEGEAVGPVEILLYAHLATILNPELPNQALAAFFVETYPAIHAAFVRARDAMPVVPVSAADPQDVPSLVNQVRYLWQSYTA